ncbi:MAG: cation:proton antiporter [Victivallaceae bacterium]|jgi:NhaP-type Na+/H+ or K+/H+ antiporter
MLFNLAVITIAALLMNRIFEFIKIPGLLGMILTGIILGPYCLDFISPLLLNISAELRTAALIVILIRAGLGINRETLNKIGIPALKMSCIPGIFEGLTVMLAAHLLLSLPWLEAGMLGFIIAAVSPAVVVPQMLELKKHGFGQNREVPTLLLAGASLDNIFAITIFGVFLSLFSNTGQSIMSIAVKLPLGIIAGLALGLLAGYLLSGLYKKFEMRDTKKMIVFLVAAILLNSLESFKSIRNILPVASLLGIMAMGFVLLERNNDTANRLASKFGKVWVFAEILLFVLIGAQVNISVALNAGLVGGLIIVIGLAGRSIGVWLALFRSKLNSHEKLFCVLAYFPKATVQAAIGAIPLSCGVKSGETILAIAVFSIILTSPLGAVLINRTSRTLLKKHPAETSK